MARSRSGTRGRRGPRKPVRRDSAFGQTPVQVAEPREREAIDLPATITVKELADTLAVNPADVIRELIKSGIFATINQLIDQRQHALRAGVGASYERLNHLPPPCPGARDSRL